MVILNAPKPVIVEKEEQIVISLATKYTASANEMLESSTFTEFQQRLQQHVQQLIDNNFEGLVQMMYRIDIDEKDFTFVLHHAEPDKVAERITDLIIKRLFRKAYFRIKYSS